MEEACQRRIVVRYPFSFLSGVGEQPIARIVGTANCLNVEISSYRFSES